MRDIPDKAADWPDVRDLIGIVLLSLLYASFISSIRSSLFSTSNGSAGPRGGPTRNGNIQMSQYGRPTGNNLQDRIYAEQSERMMEAQNDELTNRLSEKVNLLKQLSIDIGVEVKEQNRMLTDMVRTSSSEITSTIMLKQYIRWAQTRNMCSTSVLNQFTFCSHSLRTLILSLLKVSWRKLSEECKRWYGHNMI